MKHRFTYIIYAFVICGILSCSSVSTPKPRGYPTIIFPERGYISYTPDDCPYAFEIPIYAEVTKDSLYFGEISDNECWIDISMPALKGTIYISYKRLDSIRQLDQLLEDTHFLTFKHTIKADYIDQGSIYRENELYGLYYEVGGDAASPYQFYLTDSVSHFIRGALYFYTTPNADSMKPVINFVKKDIEHLISTFRWVDN